MDEVLFTNLVKEKDVVKLLNVYKGVPVSYDAEVLEIQDDAVRMKAHSLQITCMLSNRNTYIIFNDNTYKTVVSSVDIENEIVLLSQIEHCENFAKRKFVRVKPECPNEVDIFNVKTVNTDVGKWLSAVMIDISIRGMAIKMDKFVAVLSKFEVNDLVKLNFYLDCAGEAGDFQLYIDGVVRSIRLIKGTNDVRMGLSTAPGIDAENILTRYVSQRQNDILKSLKNDEDRAVK